MKSPYTILATFFCKSSLISNNITLKKITLNFHTSTIASDKLRATQIASD